MGWLIGEYWPWLVAAALLGALSSAAFSLRKVDVHTPPAAGSGVEAPAAYEEERAEYDDRSFAPPAEEEPEPEPEPQARVDPIQVAAAHFDQRDVTVEFEPSPESGEFGPGSAQPLPDGSTPSPAFTIKANATSMLFHTPESPYYGRTRAEVWFDSEASARAAGFARWDDD
jgi:hypothetical protein